ncbi:hypothetical protein BO221_39080 [Archangium sp. Cb G35]|uniref:hypothetical protein n=1 Tax=Archangium sp. Cb G35 TaxID=1920190 RepID=UPI0009358A2E|nr:hypothetical protein [Archangium sp. Cb G35]OJT18741.1 hypothetical protein BO221_39080 [Archangium sp. Cb G35]
MKPFLSLIGALFLLISIPLSNSHATPSARLEEANAKLRYEMTEAMLEGAAKHGIQIFSDGIVFASRDDGMVANTGVAEFENITYDHLARGAVVGFTYYSGFNIEPGFYRTYVVLPKGAKTGTAYLLNAEGKAVQTATVTPTAELSAARKFTGSIGWRHVTVDYHGKHVSIEVTVRW